MRELVLGVGRGAPEAMNHFEVFGLPRKLQIDASELQRKFYELSRTLHPDFHQAAPMDEQARVLEASARLNAAYRALRDPIARVEYLVRLEDGRETKEGAAVKPKAPPELLEEMFEIQETLAEAKMGGLDDNGRQRLADVRDRLVERDRDEGARLTGSLAEAWDAAEPGQRAGVLEACREALAVRAYLRTVIDDLDQALGETQEGHVAYRRH